MRFFVRLFEFIIAIFALGIFYANYPYVVIGTFGYELQDAPALAEVTSKVREYSYYGRYLERFQIHYTLPLSTTRVCRGEAIIPIADFIPLKVGETVEVKMWNSYCLHPDDARFEFRGQCFIWIHLVVGVFFLAHVLFKAYHYLNKWEVHDEPKFVREE